MQGADDRMNTRIFRDYAVCAAPKNGDAGDVCLDFVTQLTLFAFLCMISLCRFPSLYV
nr:MAG TPA: hypothetical protein [Caudoviricetes sp.]